MEIIRKPDNTMIQRNYLQIKQDIEDIIRSEPDRMINDPELCRLVINKKK